MLTMFDSLWLSDAIWRHRSGSTLAQVMGCCLMAPSHYLNQCWLLISEILWHSPESNLIVRAHAFILYDWVEKYTFQITASSKGAKSWLKRPMMWNNKTLIKMFMVMAEIIFMMLWVNDLISFWDPSFVSWVPMQNDPCSSLTKWQQNYIW